MEPPCPGIEHAHLRIIRCHRADQPPGGPGATLAECERCKTQVWVAPEQRAIMPEFDALDLDYVIRCYECAALDVPADAHFHNHDTMTEVERLRALRGAPPRSPFLAVAVGEIGGLSVVRFEIGWDL